MAGKQTSDFRSKGGLGMRGFAVIGAGLLSIAGFVGAASAADLPQAHTYTKAPAIVDPAYNWSGFYVGINGGWGSSNDNRVNLSDGHNLGSYDATGGIVGGQIGYRWQTGNWVFGLEAQGDWADLRGSAQNAFVVGNAIRSGMDAFGLFTGQIGYAWNNVLLYVKGGAAVTDRNYDFLNTVTGGLVSSSGDQANWGETVGIGLEYGFAPNWSAAIEYDHIFEQRHTVGFVTPAGFPSSATFSSGGDSDLVTARQNYRFGGPIVARY
jgi:outer membrane immunogenic protein